jgi:serine/threonine-protein kinase RsbT
MSPGDRLGGKGPSSSPISGPITVPPGSANAAGEKGPTSSQRAPLSGDPEIAASLSSFALEVYRELSPHLSPPNCRAIIAASASAAGVSPAGLEPAHLSFSTARVERTFGVFGVPPDLAARCLANLRAIGRKAEKSKEIAIPIAQEGDIVTARTAGKELSREMGFSEVVYVKVATAISELARNILKYASKGQILVRRCVGERDGIEVVATDSGPGIADVEAVLSPTYRSKSGMGVGLRGTRRLMDHFELKSQVGSGTTVIVRKYKG